MSGHNSIVLRTVYALNPRTGQYLNSNQMLLTDGLGGTSWVDTISTLIISGGPIMNDLPSTINYYSTQIYNNTISFEGLSSMSTDMYNAISTLSTAISQSLPGSISQVNLISTVKGLGTSGYVSTSGVYGIISNVAAQGQVTTASVSTIASQLYTTYNIYDISTTTSIIQVSTMSSLTGLGSIGYVSTSQLTSSLKGLGSIGYVSTKHLTSTVIGLGSAGYISSAQLYSSLAGIGEAGFISSYDSLYSTVGGLGSAGYVSVASLVSTVANLQQFYNSNSGVTGLMLTSTVQGLGSVGYVSTSALVSTSLSLFNSRTNVRFDYTGQVTTFGGTNTFYNTESIVYISSFLMSSILFTGNQGSPFNATTDPILVHDMSFSTATIDFGGFSNFITSNSRITIDMYPNIAFTKLATGASNIAVLPISTFLQYGDSNMYDTTVTSYLNVMNTRVNLETGISIDSSNFFNTPIKISIPTGTINNFSNTYNVIHYMPSSLNEGAYQNALHSNIVTPFFAPTGSMFISVQNLPT